MVPPEGIVLALNFAREDFFRLSMTRGKKLLVRYSNEGKGPRRQLRGRESAYEFKSVEKLRYDFERDVEDALRQG